MKKQRGDTIIEVLLAMSVIGVVLGSAFGIANRSLATGRAAQERTDALKIAETQLELLKTYYPLNPSIEARAAPFCIDETQPVAAVVVDDSAAACQNINGSGSTGIYSVSIVPPAGALSPYEVTVTWERINTSSSDLGTLSLFYRVGSI